MNILLVYPTTPDTFWSFKHVLRFVSKRASFPPLGLLTVAAFLPTDWEVKLVDENVNRLTDNDLRWADYARSLMLRDETEDLVLGRIVSEPVNRETLRARRTAWQPTQALLEAAHQHGH